MTLVQDLSFADDISQESQYLQNQQNAAIEFSQSTLEEQANYDAAKAEELWGIRNVVSNPHSVVPFTHLHLHTPWSLLDGFCRIDDLIKLAIEYGMDAIGVSEHGNCHSHVEFYKKCKAAGIKPILGCEVYITPNRTWKGPELKQVVYTSKKLRTQEEMEEEGAISIPLEKEEIKASVLAESIGLFWSGIPSSRTEQLFSWRPKMAHLLLIAKNNDGYKNLLEMTSRAYLEGFYFKPRCDYELIKKYGKGLIATTACLGGEIPQLIRRGRHKVAKNILKFYQSCFDELYLELQPSDMPEQLLVNNVLIEWSKELGIPLVATSDAHMLKKEEKAIHAALTTIGKSEDENDISVYEHCYFMSAKEMLEFDMPEEALRNAYAISQKCTVELEMGVTKFPKFDVPQGYGFDTYLSKLANEALFNMALSTDINIAEYQKRMNYELEIIKDKNIATYFLIVWDFIKFAKDQGILVGPGRGSAAGSLVAYLLGIVNIDPIKYDLLFERFINPERKSFPDVDTDFDYLRRHEVINYVIEKYGAENVAQIGTFTTLSTKAVFKDIGRGLGIDHNLINDMNKLIPAKFGKVYTIEEALDEVPELHKWKANYPKLFELAEKVQSLPRSSSIHACGILITDEPVHRSAPIMRGKDGETVTQYDGPTLEELGYIKFDFLGLKNLSVLNICRELVKERHNVDIDPDKLEPNDPQVFEIIRKGNTDGLFQIESDGMKKMFMALNKVDFETLIAGVSLYRPGPMENIPEYCARANGQKEFEYLSEGVRKHTETTFGILVYQEQVMSMSRELAGYSAGEADVLRKGIGKKKEEIVGPALEELHKRMLDYGQTKELADKIVEQIRPFAGYGFNRSHAAAYAYIAYQTAYFKAKYPLEFMAALMTVFADDQDKVRNYIANARQMGIEVLPPDVNQSQKGFTVEGNTLRFGLESIKGLGEAAIHTILEMRPFPSLEYIVENVPKRNLNKKGLEVLSLSGAFDSLTPPSDNTITHVSNRMELLQHIFRLRGDKFDLSEEIKNFSHKVLLEWEQKLLGLYISGHPLDGFCDPLNWNTIGNFEKFETAGLVTSFKETRTKKGDLMAFVNVDTSGGNERIVLFPQTYAKVDVPLKAGLIVKLRIEKKYDAARDEISYIVQNIQIPKKINKTIIEQG